MRADTFDAKPHPPARMAPFGAPAVRNTSGRRRPRRRYRCPRCGRIRVVTGGDLSPDRRPVCYGDHLDVSGITE